MPIRRSFLLVLAGLGCLSGGGIGRVAAQTATIPEDDLLPPTGYPREGATPDADTDLKGGGEPDFPYRRVLTGNNVSGVRNQGFFSESYSGRLEPKAGGARLNIPTDLLQLGSHYDAPLQSGLAPTNADLHLGPFYLDLYSLSSSLLYSDNINRTETDRKGGFINVEDLDMVGIFQFTDNLRLVFKAGLLYFPLENEFGLAGFSRDRFGGRIYFGNSPYMLTQFTYDLQLDKWHLHFYDNLRSVQNLQADQFNFIGGIQDDEEDRTGRYAFRTSITPSTNGVVVNETRDREAFISVVNTVGASVDRLLPTVTRFEVGAFHSDAWYYGADDRTFLPHSRDVAYVSLTSERETLRFQPFASYRVFRSDEQPFSKEARGGVSGPITEDIHFVGSAGYLWEGQTDHQRMLADARLRHIIGPYTVQELRYHRDLTYPELDLENSYTYAIRQVLGPYMYGEAYAKYATFEDLDNNGTGTKELRTGLQFTITPSSKTTIRLGGLYSQVKYTTSDVGYIDRWTAIGQLRRGWGKSWETIFTYQYQTRNSGSPTFDYYENLFVLTATYYFSERHRPPSIEGEEPYNHSVIQNQYLY